MRSSFVYIKTEHTQRKKLLINVYLLLTCLVIQSSSVGILFVFTIYYYITVITLSLHYISCTICNTY